MPQISIPTGYQRGPAADGAVFGFFGAIAGLIVAATAVFAAFGASMAAGWAVVLAAAVSAVLLVAARRVSAPVSMVVLDAAALSWALASGDIVFRLHWLAFTPTAWVWDAVMLAALVVSLRSSVADWLTWLAAISVGVAIVATAVLPRPPGGEGPGDSAEEWTVRVTVHDDQDRPLAGAKVLCAAVMTWEHEITDPKFAARETDEDGAVGEWKFSEDRRLKVVLCTASKETNSGNAGYPAQLKVLASIVGGGEYDVTFALTENPHPDVAYVIVKPTGDFNRDWYGLRFDVLIDGQVYASGGWPALRGSGFSLPASAEGHDVAVRYHFEGPGGSGLVPPYEELDTVALSGVSGGSRTSLEIRIPQHRDR